MDLADVATVMESAADAYQAGRWDDLAQLVRPLYDHGEVIEGDRLDVCAYLGIAYVQTGAWDAAVGFLEEGVHAPDPALATQATAYLGQVHDRDTATDAGLDGVQAGDAQPILVAADESLGRGDLDDAYARYWSVYDGQADTTARMTAALGVANVLARKGEYATANQYAGYVAGCGVEPAATQARELVQWLAGQSTARSAAADGTTIDEFRAAMEAGRTALFSGDAGTAREFFRSALASEQAGTVERAKAAYNYGTAALALEDHDDARAHFQWALDNGDAALSAKASERIATLTRRDTAQQLVAQLER